MLAKLDAPRAGATANVWIDPAGYQAAVAERKAAFEAEYRLQEQVPAGDIRPVGVAGVGDVPRP
jgi:hypothetical protein